MNYYCSADSTVLPLVHIVPASAHPILIHGAEACNSLRYGVGRDTGTVARRGVQARISRAERLLQPVDTRVSLYGWALLGISLYHG